MKLVVLLWHILLLENNVKKVKEVESYSRESESNSEEEAHYLNNTGLRANGQGNQG